MKNDNLNNSRRDFLRNLKNIGLGAGAASVAVFLGTKNELIDSDKNIIVASGNCGTGYNCSGGGGRCGTGYDCGGSGDSSGGSGRCGTGYNCSGGGGRCGTGYDCAGS